jgi:UDP-glucose 4-epimerase
VSILLTGGLGYIGSHTAVAMSKADYDIVIYDDLSNSRLSTRSSIEKLCGKKVDFVEGDVLDTAKLIKCMRDFGVVSVVHFAGLKAVEESVQSPLSYYDINVGGTISLLRAMEFLDINDLIFSSSATVYGAPEFLPITEDHPKKTLNPYGRTKSHIEDILSDLCESDPKWKIACLRYFNPVGAHVGGTIGENSKNSPNNLMPRIARVASGLSKHLFVFGNDYPTNDGTCERDYIHVEDVAEGHLASLNYLQDRSSTLEFFNLGSGQSCSVFKLISIFEKVTGKQVPHIMAPRRPGDAAICFADVSKSREILRWEAKKSIDEMCSSAWKFHCRNIAG